MSDATLEGCGREYLIAREWLFDFRDEAMPRCLKGVRLCPHAFWPARHFGTYMQYLIWLAPFVAVIVCIGSARVTSVGAGIVGSALAAVAALTTAPVTFTIADAFNAAARGVWLAGLLALVIFGGLFFREIVLAGAFRGSGTSLDNSVRSRRFCFAACFLIGPFTEASTGYGVGQVATISLLRGRGLTPLHIATLGLFSQILVPWGAMANGTMVGAALAKLPPQMLGFHSALLTAVLLPAWLVVFWKLAAEAGLPTDIRDRLGEFGWVAALAALLIGSSALLPPEVAALAALGCLITLRFVADRRATRAHRSRALRVAWPYAVLVTGLVVCRSSHAVVGTLSQLVSVEPFSDVPAWYPLLHPGSWLAAVGCLTAVATRQVGSISHSARRAWSQGWRAAVTTALFLIMAQLLAEATITDTLARALQNRLGSAAALATPVLAGVFGFICGSGNASNSLLMTAQAALATHAGLSVAWLAAIQNTAAAAMTMFSPARLTLGCALADAPGLERQVYARAWPIALAAMLVLTGAAGALVFRIELPK